MSRNPGQDDQLSLADLVGYRAALSGKATADDARPADPPARVGFRDLWERPDAYRGRRVTVRGRVARIFRQGPVGSFPPCSRSGSSRPAGDPFCLVFPQDRRTRPKRPRSIGPDVRPKPSAVPGPGRTVRFTGTFLKMVRYAAGDGERLAPLIVGDRPPGPAPAEADRPGDRSSKAGKASGHRWRESRRCGSRSLGLVAGKLGAGPDARGRRGRHPRPSAPASKPRSAAGRPCEKRLLDSDSGRPSAAVHRSHGRLSRIEYHRGASHDGPDPVHEFFGRANLVVSR